jgi:hypothetical protein
MIHRYVLRVSLICGWCFISSPSLAKGMQTVAAGSVTIASSFVAHAAAAAAGWSRSRSSIW